MAEVLAKHLKPELAKAILQDAYMGAKVTALLKSASLIVPTRQNLRVSVRTHEDALREIAERWSRKGTDQQTRGRNSCQAHSRRGAWEICEAAFASVRMLWRSDPSDCRKSPSALTRLALR